MSYRISEMKLKYLGETPPVLKVGETVQLTFIFEHAARETSLPAYVNRVNAYRFFADHGDGLPGQWLGHIAFADIHELPEGAALQYLKGRMSEEFGDDSLVGAGLVAVDNELMKPFTLAVTPQAAGTLTINFVEGVETREGFRGRKKIFNYGRDRTGRPMIGAAPVSFTVR